MIVAGVWTGVGFSNLKNCRTRIQKFWNRSGVGVWKRDSGHLCILVACYCPALGLHLSCRTDWSKKISFLCVQTNWVCQSDV